MKKYWLIIKNTWDEYAAYRLNFVLWRVRMIIRFLITYFLWSAIYPGEQTYFGYNRQSMLTYVLLTYTVSNFVVATRTQEIGEEINQGELTNFLLRPIHYFTSLIARDVSDKLINFGFTVVEIICLLVLLHPPFFLQTDAGLLVFSVISFIGAVAIYFCVSVLLGFIGFWTAEIWSIRFIFMVLLDFLAGNLFPLDILPPLLAKILFLTPFPYMFYFPVKIYLGTLSYADIFQGLFVLAVWFCILSYFVKVVWNKGLKIYSAEGK